MERTLVELAEKRHYQVAEPIPDDRRRSAVAAKSTEPGPGFRTGMGREAEEEQALLAALAAQDAGAFRALLDRHLSSVLATARRMLGDAAEAEDVAQETMLRLWRSGGEVEILPGGLRPWLRRIAVNLSVDRLRKRGRISDTEEVPEGVEAPVQLEILEQREVAGRVSAAISALPERQRQALTLFHYEGLSQIEIASAMGISDEAVESLLARARRTLRQGLEKDWRALVSDE